MSLSFDGSNDVVTSQTTQIVRDATTYLVWINPTSQGENNEGIIVDHGDNAAARRRFRWNASAASKKLRFVSNRATDGVWEMTTGFTTLNEWHGVVVTYDGASTSNDPIFYTLDSTGYSTLAVGSGLTETSAPSGAEAADDLTVYVGSNLDTTFAYAGLIGELAIWRDTLLSANEAAGVLLNGPFMAKPKGDPGLVLYWPMDTLDSTTVRDHTTGGSHGTVTGAVLAANPPTRPAGRRG